MSLQTKSLVRLLLVTRVSSQILRVVGQVLPRLQERLLPEPQLILFLVFLQRKFLVQLLPEMLEALRNYPEFPECSQLFLVQQLQEI